MRKTLFYISFIALLASPVSAQQKPTSKNLSLWLERLAAEVETKNLKSYYVDSATADLCERWYSCAKWAFEEYTKDQSFKIVKATLKTQRKVYRHRVKQEKHLFVEATYVLRTVYVEFITPHVDKGQPSYRFINKLPR